jgi:cystathionine gamma-lyase
MESGKYAHIYSSGLGASTTIILSLLQPGDKIIAVNDLYGGSYRLMTKVFGKYGIQFEMGNLEDNSERNKLFQSGAKMLWIESPTNPLLKTVDLASLIKEAKVHNLIIVVDNTFATPYHQQPLLL